MHEITRTFLQPNKKEITVYKLFGKIDNKYFSLCKHPILEDDGSYNSMYFEFPLINEWISCYIDATGIKYLDKNIDPVGNGLYYKTGFHSFMNYDQVYTIYKDDFYSDLITHDVVLCECRAKFRLYYGILDYIITNRDLISAELCVSRGIKIIRELEV